MTGWEEGTSKQLNEWYTGFVAVDPPREGGATRAWRGRLCPLPHDHELGATIDDLSSDRLVRVHEDGRIGHDPHCRRSHAGFAQPILGHIGRGFEVVLLDFGPKRNPRVYCPRPEISRRTFPNHPHFRDDQMTFIDGKPLAALCTYLASDGVMPRDDMALVRTLDFTAIWLLKHALWRASLDLVCSKDGLATRSIYRPSPGQLLTGGQTFYRLRFPDGMNPLISAAYRTDVRPFTIYDLVQEATNGHTDIWRAAWIGSVAPHFTGQLLEGVRPAAECPCGSGLAYRDCCRPIHLASIGT